MREFRDEEGRPWRLALTVAAAARVRDLVQIDVVDEETRVSSRVPFDLIDVANIGRAIEVIRSRYMTVAEVLYAILVPQVDERKLTREQFLDGLRGDSLAMGQKALEEELVDFFPSRLRTMISRMVAKMDELQEELSSRAEAQLDSTTIDALLEQSGTPSTKPQASSASTPPTGRSETSSSPETVASSRTGGTPPGS
jgi:hypothetical protein